MNKTIQEKKRKQDLGIFYTRPEIVDFIYDILNIWKEKEDKYAGRWESHKPKHYPSVIDPACGEGIFLKKAIERGFTKPEWVFGMDIDEEVVEKWPDINLLEAFDNDESKLKSHFFHQNGLMPIKWEQHKTGYYGKLKKTDIKNEQFNLVIGNPPYGGLGVDLSKQPHDEYLELLNLLRTYQIYSFKGNKRNNGGKVKQHGLFDHIISDSLAMYSNITPREAMSMPIEVLFIERFITLCKDDGWIAIIVPDGVLANSNMHYVREFIVKHTKLMAIVSLPRDAFKHVGTSAKTSILFLKKEKTKDWNYTVFLSSLYKMEGIGLKQLSEQYKEFYYEGKLKDL